MADNAEMSVVRLKVERALGPLADSLERELEKVDGELYTQSIRSEHHWATARQKLIRENRRGRRNAMRALQRELGASEGREASADRRRPLELLRCAAAEHTEAAQRRRQERQARATSDSSTGSSPSCVRSAARLSPPKREDLFQKV